MDNLRPPSKPLSDAVQVRQEVDLRIGAAFTRFQTLNLREVLGGANKQVLSYGPCQFPTLGFIVERYQQIRDFVPEDFWSIKLKIRKEADENAWQHEQQECEFSWQRGRLFDETSTQILRDKCEDSKWAKVLTVSNKQTKKYRPWPLNTIEAQKLISRKLYISPAHSMEIMEKLYNRGYLSYPRTETNRYNKTINLRTIVQKLEASQVFGDFARQISCGEMWSGPKNGNKDDQAHPPIHPVKLAHQQELGQQEWAIYNLVCRYFLGSLAKDAVGCETSIKVEMGTEQFNLSGLIIEQMNFLEVCTFEKWSDKYVPTFKEGEKFIPTQLIVHAGRTQHPCPMTEADLITKMDQQGIGTDATIHEHIKTVQERGYATKQGIYIVPKQLGVSLVETYMKIGIDLYKPYLRAQMEKDMKEIAAGTKSKNTATQDCIQAMLQIYRQTYNRRENIIYVFNNLMAQAFDQNLGTNRNTWGNDKTKNEEKKGGRAQRKRAKSPKKKVGGANGGRTNLGIEKQAGTGVAPKSNLNAVNEEMPEFEEDSKEQSSTSPCMGGNIIMKPKGFTKTLREMAENTHFSNCPQCNSNPLRIKATKFDTFFITCVGYPQCKTSMSMPKCISKLEMLPGTKCPRCFDYKKREVYMFRLTFIKDDINESMAEVLPDDNNTSGIYCVFHGCDDNFDTLQQCTRNINFKRTIDQCNAVPGQAPVGGQYHNKSVPNYYYEKPENKEIIQKATIKQAQVEDIKQGGTGAAPVNPSKSKKGTGIALHGCPQCHKKRHVKTSKCPANPYKTET